MSDSGVLRGFGAILRRDLTLAVRHRGELAVPVIFFVIIVSLFPLALGAKSELLAAVAPGVIWIAALLVSLLSLDPLFRADYEDGSLEQFALSPQPLPMMLLAKVIAHWVVTGLPLVAVSPLLGMLLSLPETALPALVVALTLGTPVLSAIGAIGISLTVGLRRGGMLLSLLVLPLYIPLLIFGASAVDAAAAGLPINGHLMLLAAMMLLSLALAPIAAAAGVRVSLE